MLLFSKKEQDDLKKFIADRPKFVDAEPTFTVEELQILKSQNIGEKIWNTLQLSPEQGPRFCQMNLGLTSQPISEEIKSALNFIALSAIVRIDYWALLYSRSRQSLFVTYPSLNTHMNERNKLFAYHQIDLLADECQAIFDDPELLLEKHLEVMTPGNESGLSLRRLLALQITIVKIDD